MNNRISDNENDDDNDEEDNNINIGSINDNTIKINNIRSGTIFKNNSKKNDLFLEESVLLPDYIYNGINYTEEISLYNNNENNKLENSWSDYKLFYNIVKYHN